MIIDIEALKLFIKDTNNAQLVSKMLENLLNSKANDITNLNFAEQISFNTLINYNILTTNFTNNGE